MKAGQMIEIGDIVRLKSKWTSRWQIGIVVGIDDRDTAMSGSFRYYTIKTLDENGLWVELDLQASSFHPLRKQA